METLNKTNWRDEALQLPLEDLSRIYKRLKNKRTVITSIPIFFSVFVLIGYCIAGYGAYAAYMLSAGRGIINIASAWDFIAVIFCSCILLAYQGKQGNNVALIALTAYAAVSSIFIMRLSLAVLGMYIYILAVRIPLAGIDKDIEFMRAMPTFPFNGRVSDQMINVAEYKRKKQLIESAKGNIYSDNAEQIFDKPVPEPPQYEKGDTPDDYLQRKQFYVNGKYTKTSLTDEEYDRQDDELYERKIFTDKLKKLEKPPVFEEIEDDGRLQEFDFTDHGKLNETYIISEDVYTEDFESIQKTAEALKAEDIPLSDDVQIEEFDFSERYTTP